MQIRRVNALIRMEITRQFTDLMVLAFTTLLVPILALIFGLVLNDSYGWDASETFSVFELMFPGFIAYAGLLTIYDVASKMGTERESGIEMRLFTTPLMNSEYILAQMVAYTIKPLIQLFLSLAAAIAVGYRPAIFFGTTYSIGFKLIAILLVIVTMVIFSFSSVGLGMMCAAITKTSNAAAGIAFAFIVPQQIFGSFIPPFILGMAPVGWIMPSYYPTRIMFLLFAGVPLGGWTEAWTEPWPDPTVDMWFRFGILIGFSILIFILGIIVYNQKKKK